MSERKTITTSHIPFLILIELEKSLLLSQGLSLYAISAIVGGISLFNFEDTLKIIGLFYVTRTGVTFLLKSASSGGSSSAPPEQAFAYSRANGGGSPSTGMIHPIHRFPCSLITKLFSEFTDVSIFRSTIIFVA